MDRFKLKILMILFMLLDHIAVFFNGAPFWFHYVGRVVMPVFFYLLVEGYFKTSSKANYLKRLLVASEIMFLGNIIISLALLRGVDGSHLAYSDFKFTSYLCVIGIIIVGIIIMYLSLKDKFISDKKACIYIFLMIASRGILMHVFDSKLNMLQNNIFISLVAGFIMLNGMSKFRTKDYKSAFVKTIVAVSLGIASESLIIGPVFVFIFYKCFNNRRDMYIAIIVFSTLFLPGFNIHAMLTYPLWMMVFSIPFIYIYNGKKGRDLRWLFYVFYPVHLWIIFIVSNYIR